MSVSGSHLGPHVERDHSERHSQANEEDREEDELGPRDSGDGCVEHEQGIGDSDSHQVLHRNALEEGAEMLRTERMDVDQGLNAIQEQDNGERKLNEIEGADEPAADSSVEDEDTRGDTAEAKSPSGERNVREKNGKKSSEAETPAALPVTRVKRIIKLDPDIRLVSKEGIFVIIQATQLFLEALAGESISQAWKSKRKGVKAEDIVVAAKNPKFRDGLGTTLSDFLQHLREGESHGEDGESAGESEGEEITSKKSGKRDVKRKCLQPPPGNRSITDFLKPAG